MIFNSISFAIFLPVVFIIYWWLGKKVNIQNLLLLAASFFFYSCWDWRFLFLLLFSTLLDYYSGIKINDAKLKKNKQVWLYISIIINLGFLGIFKYYNFFANSFAEAFSNLGIHIHPWTLKVILPVGISFYTFHGLSYIIDIFKGRIAPERNFITYGVFVSFFPLLVAGPIERATHLIPQIKKSRTFDYSRSVDGLRQILWGLFKKVVIADQCAEYANMIFNNPADYSGSAHLLGAIFFAVQIYGDFSGYSDIALGTARLFGIELLKNFSYPYFSRSIAEFWRRWHISLSSWFRDYVYIPLGGSKGNLRMKIRNVFIIFLLSGFWHGANWTFIIWGLLNALFIIPSFITKTNRKNLDTVAENSIFPHYSEMLVIIRTFLLTTLAWVFFRADSVSAAINFLGKIFSLGLFTPPNLPWSAYSTLVIVVFFFFTEWHGRNENYAIEKLALNWSRPLRLAAYSVLVTAILYFAGTEHTFIYFQF